MKNTFGRNVAVTLFGESHGPSVGAVIDGLPAGIPVDAERISLELSLRRPFGKISTARAEKDEFSVVSGAFRGYTSGGPLCILIPNKDARSADYEATDDAADRAARPGHADYTAHVKYGGFEDYRGGGHFSGRITAALVAAGAVVRAALEKKGVFIATHVSRLERICDRNFGSFEDDYKCLSGKNFPVLDDLASEKMEAAILDAAKDSDSVGGVLETAVSGLPAGVGDPWFDTVEGVLSHALFSVPAVKGVEFGGGFGLADMRGSEANDAFASKDGKTVTETNNCGGVLGGITTGGELLFRCAVKPTPTIAQKQKTVLLESGKEIDFSAVGRHDPCIVHRAAAVVNNLTAIVIADMLTSKYGEEWLRP